MKKKILLIEPGTELTTYPPIGLMHVASAVRKDYEVLIKDYSGKQITQKDVEQLIKQFDPFVVGIRVLTGPGIPRALFFSKIAKSLGKNVIWGGPHPTILPEQTLENEYVDAVCVGEGEYTVLDLLEYFQGKRKEVLGAGIKIKGKIKIFPPQKKIVNFKNLPLPSWDLLEDIDRYFPHKRNNMLPVSTTRGCAYKCGFCHNSNKNVKCYLGYYRIAEPQRAIDEFRFVKSLVKNEIDFLDVGEDLHLVSYEYAKRFCAAVKNSGISNLQWNTSTRYNMIDEKTVELIAAHNCKSIMLGVESGSKRLQELNGKVVDLPKAIRIAKLLRKKGVFLRNTYIFGHPTETEKELQMTIRYIKELPADENLIQLYRPMPATPYFDLCVKEKKIVSIPQKLEEWSGFGVLGHDVNVSRIPGQVLFSAFYRVNAVEQTKYWFNQQRFFLRNSRFIDFAINFIKNRFTFKLQEFLKSKT